MSKVGLLALLIGMNSALASNLVRESSARFSVSSNSFQQNDEVHMFSIFVDPEQALGTSFSELDSEKLIQKAIDSRTDSGVDSKSENKIHKVFVSHSTFVVDQSVKTLLSHSNVRDLGALLPSYVFSNCSVETCDVSVFVVVMKMSFEMSLKTFDLANKNDSKEARQRWPVGFLQNIDAVTLQRGRKFNSVLTDADQITTFKKLDSGQTLIENYNIMLVKESAYENAQRIPFLNLENALTKRLQKEMLQVRDLISNSEQTYAGSGREPQSVAGLRPLVDPEGDEAILQRVQTIPKNIFHAVVHGETPDDIHPEEWQLREPLKQSAPLLVDPAQPSIQGRLNPIRVEGLIKAFTEIISEEYRNGIQPSLGQVHQWAPETLDKFRGKPGTDVLLISKLLAVMALGESQIYTPTGQGRALFDWILTQPFNSITLPELFRATYKLNDGDVYSSLLTIQNLMAANWKYPARENLPTTQRLKPITLGFNYAEDRFGTWYHFFGMILYGYVYGPQQAHFVGWTESVGSRILSNYNHSQKRWFNVIGGDVGWGLRQAILQRQYIGVSDPTSLQESSYRNFDEDFRDRLPFTAAADIQASVETRHRDYSSIYIQSLDTDLKACQVDLMFDIGAGMDSRWKISWPQVDFHKNQKLELTTDLENVRKLRGFIHSCANQPETRVFEAIKY
jgi:hypothetical protein